MSKESKNSAQSKQFDDRTESSGATQSYEPCLDNDISFLLAPTPGLQAVIYEYSPWGEVDPETLRLITFYQSVPTPINVILVQEDPPKGLTIQEAMRYQSELLRLKVEHKRFADELAEGKTSTPGSLMKNKAIIERLRLLEEVLKSG